MSGNELIIKRVKKYADDSDAGAASAWKIALADFMCALMIVFFALWAIGNQDQADDEFASDFADVFRATDNSKELRMLLLEATYHEINELLSEQGVVVSLDTRTRSITVKFDAEMLFKTGQSELKPEAIDTIAKFANSVKGTRYYWHVFGYTDNVPFRANSAAFKNNLALSLSRAAAAGDIIMSNGIDSTRVTIHGEGALNPMDDNDSSEGRQANRRVEIYMTESSIPRKAYENPEYTAYEEGEVQRLLDEMEERKSK
ncbi:Flagellar motor rotation protein MotB [Vibrio chagasii]|nr:Flagellar motor rotation protein MotB [Vibrio chagasii]